MFIIARRCFWVAIEVAGRPASRSSLRRRAFFDIPVLGRFVVRRVEYRLWYFVISISRIEIYFVESDFSLTISSNLGFSLTLVES